VKTVNCSYTISDYKPVNYAISLSILLLLMLLLKILIEVV